MLLLFPKIELIGAPHSKEYNRLGSIVGSPYSRKLPYHCCCYDNVSLRVVLFESLLALFYFAVQNLKSHPILPTDYTSIRALPNRALS